MIILLLILIAVQTSHSAIPADTLSAEDSSTGIQQLGKTTVIASIAPTTENQLTRTVSSADQEELDHQHAQSLSDAVRHMPGIQITDQGPHVAKPVIRGMTNQRIVLVRDGIRHEGQQWSNHHTPEVDLYDAASIEVLRGPASLLYGSGALGGVILVRSPSLRTTLQGAPSFGLDASGQLFSNTWQKAGHVGLHGAWSQGMWRVDLSGRQAEYFAVPGEHHFLVKQAANIVSDTVKTEYPGFKQYNIRAMTGVKKGDYEFLLSATHYWEKQKLIGEGHWHNSGGPDGGPWYHAGEPIYSPTLHQKIQLNSKWLQEHFDLSSDLAFQHNHRQGLTKNAGVQVDLENNYVTGNINLGHRFFSQWPGNLGLSLGYKQDRTHGEEVLIPNYNTTDAGLFYLQECRFFSHLNFSAGVRGDFRQYDIQATQITTGFTPAQTVTLRQISLDSVPALKVSGSGNMIAPAFGLGIVWNPSHSPLSCAINISSAFRYPDPNELAILGAHHGSYEYLVGLAIQNPSEGNLKITDIQKFQEKSLNIDWILRLHTHHYQGEISFFYNRFNDYIYARPTGEFIWLNAVSALPVKEYVQSNARFYGLEISHHLQLFSWLTLQGGYDLVIGEILDPVSDSDEDGKTEPWLPHISPPHLNGMLHINLSWSTKHITQNHISLGVDGYFAQKRLAEFENIIRKDSDGNNETFPSQGYTLFSMGYHTTVKFGQKEALCSFKINNLLNQKYTSHLSNYKGIASNPGFDFSMKIVIRI